MPERIISLSLFAPITTEMIGVLLTYIRRCQKLPARNRPRHHHDVGCMVVLMILIRKLYVENDSSDVTA
ncbi:MAG: hypothetical protein ACREXW_08355 [Gammaproteobacteria bacterium]